jgi:protein phosphatase
MPELEFAQLTDVGCVREENEDAVATWPWPVGDGFVFAIADGLGGYAAGQVASALALDALREDAARSPDHWATEKRLRRAVQEANLKIYQRAITVTELRGMGTTLTASVLSGSTLVTAHVGDCRLLLWRDGALTQLTKDHTWVADQVSYGLLTPEQARTHPRRNMLTRCLGRELIVGIDVLRFPIRAGDVLIQCSDGVHGVVPEDEMLAALRKGDPDAACRALIDAARAAGAPDNASAQVVSVTACSEDAATRSRRWWRWRG